MPFAYDKERKQNEKNSLLDFRLQGTQLTLHSRPLPSSQSIPDISATFRPMSATPTLYHQEKHRKTPPWMRPQSADHLSSRNSARRKHSGKFDGSRKSGKNSRKAGGSLSNLMESSSMEDVLDSETSVTPSPVPSLTEVLRAAPKLEPGLAAKPPIPPIGGVKKNKSMDDIINIKFQRWFPEAVQNAPPYVDTLAAIMNGSSVSLPNGDNEPSDEIYVAELLGQQTYSQEKSEGNERVYPDFNTIEFPAFEPPQLKGPPRGRAMETIEETESNGPSEPFRYDNDEKASSSSSSKEILTSKMGRTLNKYLTVDESDHRERKNSTNSKDQSDESGIASLNEPTGSSTPQEMSHLIPDGSDYPNRPTLSGVSKVLEQENPSGIVRNGLERDESNRSATNLENGLNNDDILTWMGRNQESEHLSKDEGSTCHDILSMIKVLEKEEVESLKLEALSVGRSGNNSACSNVTPMGTREILTFLDELDQNDGRNDYSASDNKNIPIISEPVNSVPPTGRMGQLMALSSAELAKRLMAITLELEERDAVLQSTNQRLNETQEKLTKQKTDCDSIVKRHQKFIDQLLTEKKLLGEQCASVIKEMEVKHSKSMQTVEERHRVDMKKFHEKMLAAEKVKRDKWVDEKMKKIKDQTVKGLEPELERMTRAHQEELAEIRRTHEKELVEMEASCARRIAMCREQALRDREQAVVEEREAARKKLEHELSEVERSYQDQRRRLLGEVREEKMRLERDLENNTTIKSRQLEDKWQQAAQELDNRMTSLQEKHQAELKNMRETLEGERQSWLNHQTQALTQKEIDIRNQLRKEKDRHVESCLKKMEEEFQEKEKTTDIKITKMRDQYESDLKDLESSQMELRRKLKEARSENQQYEDTLAKLRTQISQLECQLTTTKQRLERAERESSERGAMARSEVSSQIVNLQRELADERARREETVASMQADKERELQQVYNRVKDAISKKEEAFKLVQKQRDAALEQCCQLENMLEQQRKEFLSRKSH